jgi:anti-anti-sigma factor
MMSAQRQFDPKPQSTTSVVLETGRVTVVGLEGEFDLTNAKALSDQMEEALGDGNNLIFDLSAATFIDSSIIHVLCKAARRAKSRGQCVVLQFGAAPIVERAVEIGIASVLARAYDRREALQALATAEAVEAGTRGLDAAMSGTE